MDGQVNDLVFYEMRERKHTKLYIQSLISDVIMLI